MREFAVKKQNQRALLLILVSFLLVALLFSLPAYSFNAAVYTKKSSNTFVGDEKYLDTLAEVNALAEEYRAGGMDVTVDEAVTLRTNSKGERTSLVTFSINQTFTKNTWEFLGAGLTSSLVLTGILACLLLSVACAVTGSLGTMDFIPRDLDDRPRMLRSSAIGFSVVGFLLVPVFAMANVVTLSRKISLYSGDFLTEGKEELYAKLDAFLFQGSGGEKIDAVLKGLTFHSTAWFWLALPCIFVLILAAIQLRHGTVQESILKGLLYAFVVAICVITLYPYYVMLVTGFRSNAETTDIYFQHMFPVTWIWSNLMDIIKRGVPRWMLNSLFIAGGATGIAMVCGIPAAYAMARMRFRGKNTFLGFVIMSQMFSPVVLLIGIAQLMSALKLNDSIFGLMLVNAAFNQAFAIWLLRGTFISISPEMEQAAKIDGCNTVQSLIKILLPMAAPGIVTTLIFIFINAWNEYTISTVLISTASNKPITVGITTFSSFNMIEWQYLFAASLLATLPVVVLFMCIEKHLTSGLTSGGVKG